MLVALSKKVLKERLGKTCSVLENFKLFRDPKELVGDLNFDCTSRSFFLSPYIHVKHKEIIHEMMK